MKKLTSVLVLFVVFLLSVSSSALCAEKSRLDVILDRGYVLVGTTGDYKPFSYLNPCLGQYYTLIASIDLSLVFRAPFLHRRYDILVKKIPVGDQNTPH